MLCLARLRDNGRRGPSYGGYAALQAWVLDPNLVKARADMLAKTDAFLRASLGNVKET